MTSDPQDLFHARNRLHYQIKETESHDLYLKTDLGVDVVV